MIRDIVTDTEKLSIPAKPATAEDAQVGQDLIDTMLASEEGCVCLAANQIGSDKAVIAYLDDYDKPHVIYNPSIKQSMRPYKTSEGCMSLEEESIVTRFQMIRVTFDQLVDGELKPNQKKFQGSTAQLIQHCIDHCNGKLV